MIPALLARKVGMTQIFAPDGARTAVTLLEAGPCVVLQVKQAEGVDGYHAVQIGFGDVKPHRSTLPEIGHARKAKTSPKRFVREIRLAEPTDKQVGDTLTVDLFQQAGVQWVDVIGTTKGRGTQGGMKRWGFGGQPASHGTERKHRSPGSIGGRGQNRGTSGAIKKGKRMGGHMGNVRRTARCQSLVGVDPENNLLLVAGSVPGPNGGYVVVRKSKTRA
ncbi:MAG: 50S ribosomal protein L3 [Phycisphaerales bacterium]|nr:50S ribosomal protein L3 [Phycisphaerales bacterium]